MSTDWTLIELCAGSAAFTLSFFGVRPPASYQGSKLGYVGALTEVFGSAGPPSRVVLVEPGPWGRAWGVLSVPLECSFVADALEAWSGEGDRALWERLRATPPENEVLWTAGFVFLQAREWSGKPASYERTAGFKPEEYPEAWNTPTRHAGRWDNPRPVLIKRLRHLAHVAWASPVSVRVGRAEDAVVPADAGDCRVLIDPPYVGTTGYGHRMDREDVVRVALRWSAAGAFVAVCEAESIPELVAIGWLVREVTKERGGQHRAYSKQKREFVTYNRELDVRQAPLLRHLTPVP